MIKKNCTLETKALPIILLDLARVLLLFNFSFLVQMKDCAQRPFIFTVMLHKAAAQNLILIFQYK
jgi:hypothetical protein